MKLLNLFKNTSKAGDIFFRGSLSKEVDLIILKNNFKTADKQPDYIASLKIKEENKLYELTGLWKHEMKLQGTLLSGIGIEVVKLENVSEGKPEYEIRLAQTTIKPVEDF